MTSSTVDTCKFNDLQVDIEKNMPQDVRSQWILNAPEPPSPWHVATDSVRKTVSNFRGKVSSLNDRSCGTVLLSALQVVFPILVWGRSYTAAKFRKDFLAGLTIASLCIPQVILIHWAVFPYSRSIGLRPESVLLLRSQVRILLNANNFYVGSV